MGEGHNIRSLRGESFRIYTKFLLLYYYNFVLYIPLHFFLHDLKSIFLPSFKPQYHHYSYAIIKNWNKAIDLKF